MRLRIINKTIAAVLAFFMLFFTIASPLASAAPNDIKGHWAQSAIDAWLKQGLVKGYKDGSFKPNAPVSRAEFVAMVNRVFQFENQEVVEYKDVKASDWYYAELQKAKAAQYISGYTDGTFQPKKPITRQEIAIVLTRLMKLSASSGKNTYKDLNHLSKSSVSVILAVTDAKFMSGYEDRTFRPKAKATRAETVVILDRIYNQIKEVVYDKAGAYDFKGKTVLSNVRVMASGVTLKNVSINGSLTLDKAIGEGDVYLQNVTVAGTTSIEGGGANSVHINDSKLKIVVVKKQGGGVRIVAEGASSVEQMRVQSAVKIETDDQGVVRAVTITEEIPSGAAVELAGSFSRVAVQSANTELRVVSGTVGEIAVSKNSSQIIINLSEDTKVDSLLLDAAATVQGKGQIDNALLNAPGATLETKPAKLEIAAGVSGQIAGETVTGTGGEASNPGTGIVIPGGGFNGGSGGGSGSETAPNPNEFLTASQIKKGDVNLTLAKAVPTGYTAWFAPNGTTEFTAGAAMTKLTGNGTAKDIKTPEEEGTYRLYLVNQTGTATSGSTSTLTVDNTAPTKQNEVFAVSRTTKSGQTVTLDAAPAAGISAWFAPAGTVAFTQNYETITMTAGGNLVIDPPTNDDVYKLFLIDEAGNVSPASAATLTVDNTAPANQDSIFPTSATVRSSAIAFTLAAAPEAGVTAWLAPASTATFTESASMKRLVGNGADRAIVIPAEEGSYKLFVIDQAGNVSAASTASLTVDNTAPSNENIFTSNVTVRSSVQAQGTVTLNNAPANGETVWFAPAGTSNFTAGATMTSLAGNGSAKSIQAPTQDGAYKLFVIDAAGNVSAASSGTLTVDNMGPSAQNNVFSANKNLKGGGILQLDLAPVAGETAWFAPMGSSSFAEGPNMTKLAGDGVNKNISIPTAEGSYRLYLIDGAGNASQASTAVLTVDATAPSTQNLVFTSDLTVKGGAMVTLAAAPQAGEIAWFAPAGTTIFAENATMSKLTGNGTDLQITAPLTDGTYKLFLLDEVGNVSSASVKTLTVDAVAPTEQNAVFSASQTVRGGSLVTLDQAPAAGVTAWLAPQGTTVFTAGSSMTSLTGNGTVKAISAPANENSYKLYLVDGNGNVSAASTAALTVDNSAPTNQDDVLATKHAVKSSVLVIPLDAAIANGVKAWLAPAGTSTFTAGANMTSAEAGSTVILLPANEGIYHLYLIDGAGNVSSPSVQTVTVDNTAPAGQDAVFTASQTVAAGTPVVLNTPVPAGVRAWLAPAVTVEFAEGLTMSVGEPGDAAILAPTTPATYKLFLIDEAGNVSAPSTATLTVQP